LSATARLGIKPALLPYRKTLNCSFSPPATPEMNPIEQVWKEIRKRGFRNEIFSTLDKVIDCPCDTVCSLPIDAVKSITERDWILSVLLISGLY